MTIKSRLVPFFAAGALVASVAAHAQTTATPDTSTPGTGQAPVIQPDVPAGTSPGTPGDTTPAAPGMSNPDTSSTAPMTAPGNDGPAPEPSYSPNANATDPSSTSTSPDANTSK